MNARKLAALGVAAAAALLLLGAGLAHADDDHEGDDRYGYPSTQSPSQGADAGVETLDNGRESFEDGADGPDRPDGADGTDTEFGPGDPRFVEGPLGGLAKDGPLK